MSLGFWVRADVAGRECPTLMADKQLVASILSAERDSTPPACDLSLPEVVPPSIDQAFLLPERLF